MLSSQIQLSTKSQKITTPFTKSLRVVHGTIRGIVPHVPAWGIDPGVNFGLTIIMGEKILVFNGALIAEDKPGRYGLTAFRFLQTIFAPLHYFHAHMIIEGAAYGATSSWQVGLSEVRTGFYLASALSPLFSVVEIKPPKNIRKVVFGDGTIKGSDEWPLLNHNAADSLAMAFYAAQYGMTEAK